MKHKAPKRFSLLSPGFKKLDWLAGKKMIRGYEIPVKNLLIMVAVFLVVLSVSLWSLISLGVRSADPNAAVTKEIASLTGRIGKTMDLPAEESPTLATVTDQAKLGGQDFFTHAQNGDKLLVYAKARKAILYRPSTGKIIDVTNLVSEQVSSNSPQDEPRTN